ncbi:MAG: hypothetical protein Q4D96_14110 [Propionibacteriaceae bacterium]|nr:hypothetical protein [Propionibacteriaceae bacterium]
MTTNRDTVTEWIEAQGETDATMLATAILDASHALAAIHEQLRIANLIAVATAGAATPFIPRDIRDAFSIPQEGLA